MAYQTFTVIAKIEGETKFFYDLDAVSLEAALADIAAAYGSEISLVQWSVR